MSYSLAYAPPEVLRAVESGAHSIVADAATDMWALGVIAFELLCSTHAFPYGTKRETICDQISGRALLPWELPEVVVAQRPLLRGLRRTVLLCLSRDPARRPSAARLLAAWNAMFDSFTTVGTTECSGDEGLDEEEALADEQFFRLAPMLRAALPPAAGPATTAVMSASDETSEGQSLASSRTRPA